jgi:hypothetical protein
MFIATREARRQYNMECRAAAALMFSSKKHWIYLQITLTANTGLLICKLLQRGELC